MCQAGGDRVTKSSESPSSPLGPRSPISHYSSWNLLCKDERHRSPQFAQRSRHWVASTRSHSFFTRLFILLFSHSFTQQLLTVHCWGWHSEQKG